MFHNDIIKSIGYCMSTVYECDKCPYIGKGCSNALYADTIALIKGQKAVIEILEERCESLSYEYRNHYEGILETEKETNRIEAIKEIVERIKLVYHVDTYKYLELETSQFVRDLDTLVKEMTEEKK